MKRIVRVIVQLIIISGFCGSLETSRADIYKYIDKKGVIHLTNIPTHNGYKMVLRDARGPNYNEQKYDKMISALCRKYGVEVPLVKAVIKAESDFNPLAVSKRGAQGLMQLMPFKAKELSVFDPFDPYQNIDGGVRCLRGLLDKFKGDISMVLAAYNAGENAVLKNNNVPPFSETQNYIKKVLEYKRNYQ